MNLTEYLKATEGFKFRKAHKLNEKGVWAVHAPDIADYAITYLGVFAGTLEEAITRALKVEGFIYAETNTVYYGTLEKVHADDVINFANVEDTIKKLEDNIAAMKKTKARIAREAKEIKAFLKKRA